MNKPVKGKQLSTLARYEYDDEIEKTFFKKNNFLIDLEEYRDSNGSDVPLNRMQWMIIQTSFYLAHQLNQKHKKNIFDAETVFSIKIDQFCKLWDIKNYEDLKSSGVIYTDIKRSLSKLRQIRLKYPELESDRIVESGYFAYITYGKQEFTFGFPKPMIDYIKELGNFTWYYFQNMIKLQDNVPASILYEYLSKNKHLENRDDEGLFSVQIKMDTLKKVLSPTAHSKTAEFRRHVLDPTISYINAHTSMEIKNIDVNKIGRNIDSISFNVKLDRKDFQFRRAIESANSDKPFLNDRQCLKFALALSKLAPFCDVHQEEGEEDIDLFERLKRELKDNQKVIEYQQYLKAVGFESSSLDYAIKHQSKEGTK